MFARIAARIRRLRMKTIKSFGRSTSNAGLALSLGDREPDVALALAQAFGDVDSVEVVEGNLLDLSVDAIVSPANSFGDMGGGIDKAIDDFHEGAAQRAVMAAIATDFLGDLPVGAAIVVTLHASRLRFVVAAPTMRVPGNVADTINAYHSMRAALVAVLRHNASSASPIRSLAIPGLCTGVGGMHPREAAQQLRIAYDNVIGGNWKEVISPVMAPYSLR